MWEEQDVLLPLFIVSPAIVLSYPNTSRNNLPDFRSNQLDDLVCSIPRVSNILPKSHITLIALPTLVGIKQCYYP